VIGAAGYWVIGRPALVHIISTELDSAKTAHSASVDRASSDVPMTRCPDSRSVRNLAAQHVLG